MTSGVDDLELAWNAERINMNETNIRGMLHGFKYIIEVSGDKLCKQESIGYSFVDKFIAKYRYPAKELGQHSVSLSVSGFDTNDNRIFERSHEQGYRTAFFIGTNNEEDAIMIVMEYK